MRTCDGAIPLGRRYRSEHRVTEDDRSRPDVTSQLIHVPIAPGELVDKITILDIKLERIVDTAKLENIRRELDLLRDVQRRHLPSDAAMADFERRLREVNGRIWTLEDTIRECERSKSFDELFLETARAIYRTNDERAAVKREINLYLGSQIVEEKSYAAYE